MKGTERGTGFFAEHAAGITAIIIFAAVIFLYAVFVFQFPALYILATYEDLPGEWTQVFFFAATLVASLVAASRSQPHRLFFIFLALACFYVVGEEISWGQRLLAFASPDFFQQHNLQQEVNLHNFLTGPVGTWQKRVIEIALVAGLVGYGLVYPLLRTIGSRAALWLQSLGLPAPPLYMSPFFVTAALCEVRLFSFNEAEVAELLIAMALVFLALFYIVQPVENKGVTPASGRLAAAMIGVVLLAVTGAGTVSWYSWNSPQLQEKMEQRITAGQKKFARRYSRHGSWQHAADLYERVLVRRPKNSAVLRELAACYRELGRTDKYLAASGRAIRFDMIRYARNPRRVSVNLSLFKSFEQAGNREKASFHLAAAVEQSRDKVLLEPYNADSFYWLGKTLQALGDPEAAAEQFARAVSMKPASKKYRRAYLKNMQQRPAGNNGSAKGQQRLVSVVP